MNSQNLETPPPSERLFIGVYPTGIVYADRGNQIGGDYKRTAFLPYNTLTLQLDSACPPELIETIKTHSQTIINKRGEQFAISACNQNVTLGKPS